MADSEKYFTKTVDGQLSVATVAQSGDIIPEESRPGEKYTTALVQTDDGPQLCVKTFEMGGGGGGGTVDQTYDPTSTNAQSGTAVAEAVAPALKNKATQNSSIIIAPNTTTTFGSTSSIYVGNGTWGSIANFTTVIGANISQGPNNTGSTVVGYGAKSTNNNGTAFGRDANSLSAGVSIGYSANANGGLAVGSFSKSSAGSVAIGTGYSTSKGVQSTAYRAIAIGTALDGTDEVVASAQDAIQLGVGTNATAKTLQVFEHQLLDGTTGLIHPERLGTGYDDTKTQVLKHVNGVLTWVDEA